MSDEPDEIPAPAWYVHPKDTLLAALVDHPRLGGRVLITWADAMALIEAWEDVVAPEVARLRSELELARRWGPPYPVEAVNMAHYPTDRGQLWARRWDIAEITGEQ